MFCNTSRISQSGITNTKASERSFSWMAIALAEVYGDDAAPPNRLFCAEEAMMARMPYRHISRSIRPRQAPLLCVRRAA
jgi:hypothetical protein